MTEEIEQAERALRTAASKLDAASSKGGDGAEARYGQAYQALVRLGARRQLRRKYRAVR